MVKDYDDDHPPLHDLGRRVRLFNIWSHSSRFSFLDSEKTALSSEHQWLRTTFNESPMRHLTFLIFFFINWYFCIYQILVSSFLSENLALTKIHKYTRKNTQIDQCAVLGDWWLWWENSRQSDRLFTEPIPIHTFIWWYFMIFDNIWLFALKLT